jgi:hypothetical protein
MYIVSVYQHFKNKQTNKQKQTYKLQQVKLICVYIFKSIIKYLQFIYCLFLGH